MNILPIILKPDRHECYIYSKEQIVLAFNFFYLIKNNRNTAQYAFEYTCGIRKKIIKEKKVSVEEKIQYSSNWLQNKNLDNFLFYKELIPCSLDIVIKDGMRFLGNKLISEKELIISVEMWKKIYDGLLDDTQPWVKDVLKSLTSDKSIILLYVNYLTQEQIRFFKIVIRYLFSDDYPNTLKHKARKSILHIPEENELNTCLSGLEILNNIDDFETKK